ncbi:MAG TPA: hypothetical protein VH186_28140 [Chloroflexia bacterium]|nr:hypothetical protein [Chloroflexia bacterium]
MNTNSESEYYDTHKLEILANSENIVEALKQTGTLLHSFAQPLTIILNLAELNIISANSEDEKLTDFQTIYAQGQALKDTVEKLRLLLHHTLDGN